MADRDEAVLRYMVQGSDLALPERAGPGRADGLWESTCFELFLQPVASEAYFEFNFSPSTKWAAYAFDSHREGRRDLPQPVEPMVRREAGSTIASFALEAEVDFSGIPRVALQIGLCAIILEPDGTKSYWALAHPPGDKPDFHDPACFALELPAASEA